MKKIFKILSKYEFNGSNDKILESSDNRLGGIASLSNFYPNLYVGYTTSSHANVVIKKYDDYFCFKNEVKIMNKISEHNKGSSHTIPIPKIIGYSLDKKSSDKELNDSSYYLVMEKKDAHDLMYHIENKSLNKLNCLKIIKQLVRAINILHKQNIAHRDIKYVGFPSCQT